MEIYPKSQESSLNQVKVMKIDPYKVYTLIKKIGKSAKSCVYKAQNSSTGEIVALKQIELIFELNKEKILNEIGTIMIHSHPNILPCYAAFEFQQTIYISLELMDETISSLLNRADLNEIQISYVIKEVLKGIDYLNKQNRLHREIKSDNILFNSKGEIKISDFGLSTQIASNAFINKSHFGTSNWIAPEIICGKGYSSKVDIWAVGVLILEMTEKRPPLRADNSMDINFDHSYQLCAKARDNWSAELNDFTQICFEKDPEDRASAAELMFHKFLRKGNREEFLKVVGKFELC